MKGLSIFMIFLLLTSITFVVAQESDTVDVSSDRENTETGNTNNSEDTDSGENVTSDRQRALDRAINASTERSERAKTVLEQLRRCHNILDRETRIICRLKITDRGEVEEELEGEESAIPEACRNFEDRDSCRRLYRAVNHCHDLESGEKNKCFRRIAGFVKAKITDEETERGDKIRRYLNFLLNDLEIRIERNIESGEITPEQAAPIIDKITEIKEDLLNKEPKSIIKPKLQELRTIIKELKEQQTA